MNKKLKAYLLIGFGCIPVLIKIVIQVMSRTGQTIVFHNQKLYNLYAGYATGAIILGFFIGILMIVIGTMILKKEKARELTSLEEHELNEGERLVYKKIGGVAIVTVTNQRLRYYRFLKNDRETIKNLPAEREDFSIAGIKSVKVVGINDIMKSWIKVKSKWGIQLELKDGRIVNIPIEEQEVLANHIDNLTKLS